MMRYDIVIIGAGPAGLSLACSLADTHLRILLIEQSSIETLRNPPVDGREIALTHHSQQLLQDMGVWQHFPPEDIASLNHARVLNGESSYALRFDNHRKDIEALGYLVPNDQIRKALFKEFENKNNIELLADVSMQDIEFTSDTANITLSNGQQIECALLVAADSRFSATRKKTGIPADMHDFSRTAIVCRMQHEKSHQQTALECFLYGRTIAILPMNGNMSSVVMTVSNDRVKGIMAMNEADFNREVQHGLKNSLGAMTLTGDRYAYPLVAVHAKQFYSHRFALIGDAAVGMHPVTAHGFNLGLRGQQILADEIKAAIDNNKDFSHISVLRNYHQQHMKVTRPLYLGTNVIVNLFTSEQLPARILRSATLRFANHFPPLKQMITNKLTERQAHKSRLPFLNIT